MGGALMALGAALISLSFLVPDPASVFLTGGGIGFLWAGYFRRKDGC